jgi:hypothetical protein
MVADWACALQDRDYLAPKRDTKMVKFADPLEMVRKSLNRSVNK